jgi:putative ABC transport system substrate-binding protein
MKQARFSSVILLGLGFLLAPAATQGQQAERTFHLGWLGFSSAPMYKTYTAAYRDALRTLGYEEGRNYTIDFRFADGDYARLPALAGELAARKEDLILASSEPSLVAVMEAGAGIPVVVVACDPLEKLLGSIRRPGGNATGFSCVSHDLVGKRIGFLKELVPGLSRIALLYGGSEATEAELTEAEGVARAIGVEATRFPIRTADDVDAVMNAIASGHQQAVYIFTNALTSFTRARLAQQALALRLPAIFGFREFAEAGGLISYGADLIDGFQRAAYFTARILKGTRPSDLPAEEPTRFYLTINQKTAAALGIQIPPTLLVAADRVIE